MFVKNNEIGRSMIEMLGVLAIIGVLSIGGVNGYTKAMNKYKINKTIELVSNVSSGIQTLFTGRKDRYKGADDVDALQKANIVDENILEEGTDDSEYDNKLAEARELQEGNPGNNTIGYSICNSYGETGSDIWRECAMAYAGVDGHDIATFLRNMHPIANAKKIITPFDGYLVISAGNKIFSISLINIPEEACIEIVSKDWGSSSSGFRGLSVGGKSITSGVMSIDDAIAGCSGNNNTINFTFQ